ncbi:MAG: phosphotransacetylase family protein [candidate division NC10 bacterium]|nr:phosphotransacetylase family protein [candidate division NC10 bacterium]
MIPLYINSTSRYSGKSVLALGMGTRFKRDGYRLGYFKPVGWLPVQVDGETTDLDALFMQRALELEEPLEQVCPVVMTEDMIQLAYEGKLLDVDKKILNAFRTVSRGKDIVLLGGAANLFEGGFIGARGIELAAALDAKILLVDLFQDGVATIESLLYAKDLLGDRLVGGVINRVPPEEIGFVSNKVLPFLAQRGIDVLGVIPEDKVLGAVSVRHLTEMLPGSVICREDKLDELLETFMVGAMSPDHALKYLQRGRNIALITGGDRPDIQLAALQTSVKAIVLTGGFYPNDIIVARAEERGVPLILVDQDTFSVVQRFESMLGRLELREEKKVNRAKELADQMIDFSLLYRKLGLSS